MRGVGAAITLILVGLILLDQSGLLGYRGSDWSRFDKKQFSHFDILSGDELKLITPDESIPVRLIGIDAPDSGLHGDASAFEYAAVRMKGRTVTLKLEPTQTRDADGKLLAYVYLADNETLNLALIRDGKAYADRRTKHTFAGQFEQAEADARKKRIGIWKDLTEEQMPAWRRMWLEQLRRDRQASTRPAARIIPK